MRFGIDAVEATTPSAWRVWGGAVAWLSLAALFGATSGCGEPTAQGTPCSTKAECAPAEICREGICVLIDTDGDGKFDGEDNCPGIANPGQGDLDGDGLGDECDPDLDGDGHDDGGDDNCPGVPNPDQADLDRDGVGDACDTDTDGDGVPDERDNCVRTPNRNQADRDRDGIGDACDPDRDGDGHDNDDDNCPDVANATQADSDGNGVGDACDPVRDDDRDTIPNDRDNCPTIPNTNQADADGDGIGDVCDADADGDGTPDDRDNCPGVDNPDQRDTDGDGQGDACDSDLDNDGVPNVDDNCVDLPNQGQADGDGDDRGDACDSTGVRSGGPVNADCKLKQRVVRLPTLEWSWPGTQTLAHPTKTRVMMTPLAADVDADGITEVVFTGHDVYACPTTQNPNALCLGTGALVVVDGRNGTTERMVVPTNNALAAAGQLAIGNLDNSADGTLEIVALRANGGPVVLRADGTVLWSCSSSTTPSCADMDYAALHGGITWGGFALANLDGDPEPELVYGAQVFNRQSNGSYVRSWKGTQGAGDNGVGPLSVPVDLDLDGTPEIVTGNTAYRANGTVYWHRAQGEDGFVAAGNFDQDANPEVVVVANGKVILREHSGEPLWEVTLPVTGGNAGRGGAPTVADFDGDGFAEVGVATRGAYVVYDTDGEVLWQKTTQDYSSSATGSSVFDFEGDGYAEVVYNDERMFRVYDGETGETIFERANTTATAYEYPVIANVDADASAELIVAANPYGTGTTQTGVSVWGNTGWRPTRKIWNQHAYHVTNIDDDGRVPATFVRPWTSVSYEGWPFGAGNTFRANAKDSGANFVPAADLQLSGIDLDFRECAETVTIRVWVDNFGNATVPAGVRVSVHTGAEPTDGNRLASTRTTSALAPGQSERVGFEIPGNLAGLTLVIVVDDEDLVAECSSKANNLSPGITQAHCE